MKIKEMYKNIKSFIKCNLKLKKIIFILLMVNFGLLFYILIISYTIVYIQPVVDETNDFRVHEYPKYVFSEALEVDARSALVYEKDSRVVVYRMNDTFRFSPASSTKIMTALIALENYSLDDVLEARNISVVEGSKMNLYEEEKIKVRDLLYGLLLPSGNDAAYVLAENFPGGEEAFVWKMNEKARDLHLMNTSFVDPSGYEDENYTTAYDLARLAAYAMDNEIFSEIVKTKSKTVYDATHQINHTLQNLNELLDDEGVNGVKTGFTEEAGGVFVCSLVNEGKTYIVVVLKSKDRFVDTRDIIKKVVKNIKLLTY